MEIPIRLAASAVLIALTAFFVASEFAIVKMRTSRINELVEEGNSRAKKMQTIANNLDEYLSACQLGITVTAIGLGLLAQPTIHLLLEPILAIFKLTSNIESVIAFIISFSIITFVHVVLGKLTPRVIAIQEAEKLALLFARPLSLFYVFLYPAIKSMSMTASFIVKLFGFKNMSSSDVAHSEEELRMILSDSLKGGEINQFEYKYVNKIFEFDDRIAKEIMMPRTEMMTVDKNMTIQEVFDTEGIEQYTRYPVTNGDKDHIIGLINMKNLLTEYIKHPQTGQDLIELHTQPIIQVIETMPIGDLLLKIQRERIHMAVLVDEYGGTAGLVTIEDILEEIVGDIQDEFDTDEIPEVQKLGDFHYIFDSKLLIDDVNDILNISIDNEDVDTIGGWFMNKRFDMMTGETIVEQDFNFTIKDMDGQHILYLEVTKHEPSNLSNYEEIT